jgi:dihydroorotase
MLGLETALGVVAKTMVETGLMSWSQVAEVMSISPARIGGYVRQGQKIAVGAPANLTVINTTQSWSVDRQKLASKSLNTPFHGDTLPTKVIHTIYEGVFVVKDGGLTGMRYE